MKAISMKATSVGHRVGFISDHRSTALAFILLAAAASLPAAERPATPAAGLDAFLTERGIDRESRRVLEAATEWGDAEQKMAIRVLARISAPAELAVQWRADARDFAAGSVADLLGDRLVRVQGRATFIAPQVLTPEQEQLAGRPQFDVVRIVDAKGGVVDVLTNRAPKAWARWKTIDEPASAVGLPLSAGVGPRPGPPPQDGQPWPEPRAALELAATGITWQPPTTLGGLGMDYTLFDTVRDGGKLEAGDAEAFYGMLAAVARDPGPAAGTAATTPEEMLTIINPADKWFAGNRGERLVVAGVARKATRIAIDDPLRRGQVGVDHYWELFVFVDTPLIKVDDREQKTYPIVCCVRTLPEGMPTGDAISERVRVSGFTLKRYGYPLADVAIVSSQGDRDEKGKRMETALVIADHAVWLPNPTPRGAMNMLFWIFAGLAAAVALVLGYGAWAMGRDARLSEQQARSELPDRIDLPGGD